MTGLIVPPLDAEPWPTLGPQICDLIEERCTFGPGDLRGEPAVIDDETRALFYRAYEVFPKGHPKAGRRRFKRVCFSLRKGTAKCLAPDVSVLMADGTLRRADEVRAGDEVVGWDGSLRPAKVTFAERQPLAAAFEVTTDHGRRIVVTGEHPFLVKGTRWEPGMPVRWRYSSCDPDAGTTSWVKAEELRAGDRLMVSLDWHGDGNLPAGDAWLLGAFVGDGSPDGRFTSEDSEIVDRIGDRFPMTYCGRYDWYARGSRPFLREHGLLGGTSRTKRVPSAVMRAKPEAIRAFLAGYLDTDGHVEYKPLPSGKTRITVEWASVSRELLEQCQHLLAAIGVNGSLHESRSRYQGRPYASYKLSVHDAVQSKMLADQLDLTHPRKAAALARIAAHKGRCSFAGRDLDRVKSVRAVGSIESIAIEVDDCHTHITNGLVTHNTEKAAWLAFAELHPEGPVRCDGFDANGDPVGRPVRDPYIPMVAYTEKQTEELAYAALFVMVSDGPDADLFDPTAERIRRWNGDGKAVALAAAPNSRDGARTTFQHFDEPHRMTAPRLIDAHQTMLQNIPKRPIADPWSLSTTTAGVPGEGSVAETEKEYAEKVAAGKARDPQLFYIHREASPGHDLETDEGLRAAIVEASGPAVAAWSDIDSIMSLYHQDDTDRAYFERVWLNRWVASSRQAFDPERWVKKLARPGTVIAAKEAIVIGFDGARWRDACGFVGTHIETGFQWPIAVWERPAGAEDWEVTDDEVDGALDEAMKHWRVLRVYADPPRFEANVAKWAGKHGSKVMEWYTNRPRQIGQAMRAYRTAMDSGEVTHGGDKDFARHIANARKGNLKVLDDDDTPLWTIYKERPDSEKYIDLAMAGCLSWQARLDALAKGGWQRRSGKMIVRRG